MDENANVKTMKAVFTVVERGPGKSYWTRIGVGFVNRDGSINLRLDALPTNGTIQVRDWEPMDKFGGDAQAGQPGQAGQGAFGEGARVRRRDGSSAMAPPPAHNADNGPFG